MDKTNSSHDQTCCNFKIEGLNNGNKTYKLDKFSDNFISLCHLVNPYNLNKHTIGCQN